MAALGGGGGKKKSKQSGKNTHQQLSPTERTTVWTVMQYTDSIKAFFNFRPSHGVSYPHERNYINTYERSVVCLELNFTKLGNSKQHYVLTLMPNFAHIGKDYVDSMERNSRRPLRKLQLRSAHMVHLEIL